MKDKMWHWIARQLPHRLVYWCAIHLFAKTTQGRYSDTVVGELTVMEALKRWDT